MEVSLAELKKTSFGVPVTVRGVLSDVKERKSGSGKRGPWSFQGAKLTEGKEYVYVSFQGHEDVSALDGREITIISSDEAEAYQGAFWDEEEYQDKKYKKLIVTKSAAVEAGETAKGGSTPSQQNKTPSRGNKTSPGPLSVEQAGMVRGNLYISAVKSAAYTRSELEKVDFRLTPENFQACVSTIFISLASCYLPSTGFNRGDGEMGVDDLLPEEFHKPHHWSDKEKAFFKKIKQQHNEPEPENTEVSEPPPAEGEEPPY
jgi:hypothetical protein